MFDSKLTAYKNALQNEEKSAHTVEKYLRDVRAFFTWMGDTVLSKDAVIAYKNDLMARDYTVKNINSTRIYIVSTGTEHRRFMEKMRLVL